jgi:hypothetical protein
MGAQTSNTNRDSDDSPQEAFGPPFFLPFFPVMPPSKTLNPRRQTLPPCKNNVGELLHLQLNSLADFEKHVLPHETRMVELNIFNAVCYSSPHTSVYLPEP